MKRLLLALAALAGSALPSVAQVADGSLWKGYGLVVQSHVAINGATGEGLFSVTYNNAGVAYGSPDVAATPNPNGTAITDSAKTTAIGENTVVGATFKATDGNLMVKVNGVWKAMKPMANPNGEDIEPPTSTGGGPGGGGGTLPPPQ